MGLESELDDPDTHPFPPPPLVPWRCQGHPLVDLPHEFDGVLVTVNNLDQLLRDAIHGSLPAGTLPPDHSGPAWAARMHVRLAGTRWAQTVDDIGTQCLDDPSPQVKRNAVEVFARLPLTKGRHRLVEILQADVHAFDGLDAKKLLDRIQAEVSKEEGSGSSGVHWTRVTKSDGSQGWIRKAFRRIDYAVPRHELERLRSFGRWKLGSIDELELHDGAFSAYVFVRQVERDGKRFVVLRHSSEWVIEVELTRGEMGKIVPWEPEKAWELARERDRGAG